MKIVKPKYGDPPKNRVQFICHNAMSRVDVKNYLEKIYKIPVVSVRIRIQAGEFFVRFCGVAGEILSRNLLN